MKDLTANDLEKTEQLNSLLLKEWMQAIEEIQQLKAENERLNNLNEAKNLEATEILERSNAQPEPETRRERLTYLTIDYKCKTCGKSEFSSYYDAATYLEENPEAIPVNCEQCNTPLEQPVASFESH